jgi:hypothetical protein
MLQSCRVIAMDTILVVNAGSSSVKFQVFSVKGEGKLQRLIKGQMVPSPRDHSRWHPPGAGRLAGSRHARHVLGS